MTKPCRRRIKPIAIHAGVTIFVLLVVCLGRTADAESNFNVAQVRRGVVFIKRVTPRIASGTGSGFLVNKDGLIYTNRHVIEPATEPLPGTVIYVGVASAADPDELDYFRASVVYTSNNDALDFAILKIAAGRATVVSRRCHCRLRN